MSPRSGGDRELSGNHGTGTSQKTIDEKGKLDIQPAGTRSFRFVSTEIGRAKKKRKCIGESNRGRLN